MTSVYFRLAVAKCVFLFAVRVMAQEAAGTEALEKRFQQLDKNADGQITTDELPPSPFFKQRDSNQDGAITLAEAQAFLEGEGTPAAGSPAAKKGAVPAAAAAGVKSPRASDQRVQPLKAGDCGVGQMVADASFQDLAGTAQKFSALSEKRAVVIAMTSTSCPLSKKYLPTLASLAKAYSRRGVAWVVVNPIATDKPAEMKTAAQALAGNAIYVHDREQSLTKALGARTTTDVIVLDSARTMCSWRIDDSTAGLRRCRASYWPSLTDRETTRRTQRTPCPWKATLRKPILPMVWDAQLVMHGGVPLRYRSPLEKRERTRRESKRLLTGRPL